MCSVDWQLEGSCQYNVAERRVGVDILPITEVTHCLLPLSEIARLLIFYSACKCCVSSTSSPLAYSLSQLWANFGMCEGISWATHKNYIFFRISFLLLIGRVSWQSLFLYWAICSLLFSVLLSNFSVCYSFLNVYILACPAIKAIPSHCWCCPAFQCYPPTERIEKLFINRSFSVFIPLGCLCVCLFLCLPHTSITGLHRSQTTVLIVQLFSVSITPVH